MLECHDALECDPGIMCRVSGIGRPAGAGFAVILTAKSKAVGTTASRHSQDGCVPILDLEVALTRCPLDFFLSGP